MSKFTGNLTGLEVSCSYRRPMDHAHPDCWGEPIRGTVLAYDDPRAWRATFAFPANHWPSGPSQEEATAHAEWCASEDLFRDGCVPVLYRSADGREFVQWDRATALAPYQEMYERWKEAREAARGQRAGGKVA
jgi:hypothetical protein